MKYYIFTLKFLTPVHFNDANDVGNLESVSLTCSADTFFNALCNEAVYTSCIDINNFIDKFADKEIKISSLFPYYIRPEQGDDLELYLPKPFISPKLKSNDIRPFSEMKQILAQQKILNDYKYIRVSKIKDFIQDLNNNTNNIHKYNLPQFAAQNNTTKVNQRLAENMPYYVSSYRFNDNAGLYFIAGFENDDDYDWFCELVETLGYTGIGGKRSSGYGKYELQDTPIELIDAKNGVYLDDGLLADMFNNTNENKPCYYLCIAPVIPESNDVYKIKYGSYKLLKRSGFIYADKIKNILKRNCIYAVAEGSCFFNTLDGTMPDFKNSGLSHPIYRNGIGMFVRLNL